MSSYQNAFMSGKISRESCYSCQFSQCKRCSDYTIGDFWGVKEVFPNLKDTQKGVSLLLVNTENGTSFLEEFKEKIEIVSCPYEKIASRNANLVKATTRPESRNDLESLFKNRDSIVDNVPCSYYKDMIKFYIKKILRRL